MAQDGGTDQIRPTCASAIRTVAESAGLAELCFTSGYVCGVGLLLADGGVVLRGEGVRSHQEHKRSEYELSYHDRWLEWSTQACAKQRAAIRFNTRHCS